MSKSTDAFSINTNGDIVGWHSIDASGQTAGFKLSGGKFASFAYPGAEGTLAYGINDSGEIVGEWDTATERTAFTYKDGKFQSYSYPGAAGTVFTGINNAGAISGFYIAQGNNQLPYGFVYRNGKYETISIPNTNDNIVYGVNNKGNLAGTYQKTLFGNNVAFIGTSCH